MTWEQMLDDLQQARGEAGMGPKHVEALTGISRQHLYQIEHGQVRPAIMYIEKLLAAYGWQFLAGGEPTDSVDIGRRLAKAMGQETPYGLGKRAGYDDLQVRKALRGDPKLRMPTQMDLLSACGIELTVGRAGGPPDFVRRYVAEHPSKAVHTIPTEEMQALYYEGYSLAKIADIAGISVCAVRGRLKKAGTRMRPSGRMRWSPVKRREQRVAEVAAEALRRIGG